MTEPTNRGSTSATSGQKLPPRVRESVQPCEDGDHCNHRWCKRDENHCCWCGEEMKFDEGPE